MQVFGRCLEFESGEACLCGFYTFDWSFEGTSELIGRRVIVLFVRFSLDMEGPKLTGDTA